MEKFFNSLRKKTIIQDESISGVPFLIVGLGNPGREYRESRHNFGFMVVDRIVGQLNSEFAKVQLKSLISQVSYQGNELSLRNLRRS